MIAPARHAAFMALVAHEARGTDLPTAVAAARRPLTDSRDQALLTELVTGTVRMRLAIDYQLALRTSWPLAALDAVVRTALRLGAFQLLYLDRLPASAVVNDAVALTRHAALVLSILGYQMFAKSSIVKAAAVVLAPLALIVVIGTLLALR